MSTIMVLGKDGFCGWPTSLHLSQLGYVVTVDNLSRRKIDFELEVDSLTPISPMSTKLAAWQEVTGKRIRHVNRCTSLWRTPSTLGAAAPASVAAKLAGKTKGFRGEFELPGAV
jgi:nucleoside-diphosphate-sugar epimerase